jgi:hypothetical protein
MECVTLDVERPASRKIHRDHRGPLIVLSDLSKDLMLWPGAVWPPDIHRGVVTTLDGRAGMVTSRQRNGEEHGRFRGILFPCPCTGPRHLGVNFSKQRPKTQWYIKVGHGCDCHRDGSILIVWRRSSIIIYRRSLRVNCGTRHEKFIVPIKYGDQLVTYHFTLKMFDTNGQQISVILLSMLKHILRIISQIDGTKCNEKFHALGLSNLRSFNLCICLIKEA